MYVKVDEKSSEKFGKNPYSQTFLELFKRGFLNCDKHTKETSHKVVDELKKILNIEKAGHSGTLDPQVTGVLLIGLGKGTRLMEYMLLSKKEYVCLVYFHKSVDDKKLDEVFKKFTGEIMQTPPIISAVRRVLRKRTIYKLEILEKNQNNQYVLFKVECEKGTYIRKLCSDMGEYLEIGAQMVELRRLKAGPIYEDDFCIGLDNLKILYKLYMEEKDEKNKEKFEKELRKYIRPYEELLKDFKKVYLRDSAIDSIAHGCDLAIPGVCKLDENIYVGDLVVMLSLKGELVGLGISYLTSKQVLKKDNGAFIKTKKIFMDIGTYPSIWNFRKGKEEEN